MSRAEGDDALTFGGEELVPRKGSSSVVWKCFGFRASEFPPQGNTTKFNHLEKYHRPQYDECMKAKAKWLTLPH